MGERGALRIYLGAAPGVGKTYAMLGEAHRRLERGTDVVVGFVETYGRVNTAALLDGLEVLPRRTVTYRGARLEELDVDAVLARRPQVVVVDELAHTNAPGSRNGKRWQDVDELLAAGIEVLTTVNVQSQVELVWAISSWFSKKDAVVPREVIYPPNTTEQQVEQQNAEDFAASQTSAMSEVNTRSSPCLTMRPVVVPARHSPASARATGCGCVLQSNR